MLNAPLVLPCAMVPLEAARGVDPQEWATVRIGPSAEKKREEASRRSASAGALRLRRSGTPLQLSTNLSASQDSIASVLSVTPDSPDGQIFEYLRSNCKTEEYVEKIVPSLVQFPRSLKDVPEFSRTLTGLPDGLAREKEILEDLGHKNPVRSEEDDEEESHAPKKMSTVNLLKSCALKYTDEARCVDPVLRRRQSSLRIRALSPLSALSQRLPLPRNLRHLTVKNIKISLGKLCRRRTVVITESDPTYKVAYLGNVLTGWAKGEGCAEKPLSTLWKNYTASNKPDVNMKVAVTRSGLKATTREHGLTEYWSHRITHCAAPPAFPRVFCWVYRHEGRKLKQELRCHAVLCAREDQARRMAEQLSERLALALLEFRRDKHSREQARLSLANALYDNPTLPQRKLLLSTGASNYRPPLERSKSAPKLGAIEESAEEEEGLVFGQPRAVTRFLREERLASTRRQRFRESLRRKMAAELNREAEPQPELEPEDLVRGDPRRETLVRVKSVEAEPDPPEDRDERTRVEALALQRLHENGVQDVDEVPAQRFLLDSEGDNYRQDASESDEGSSSLQSISSDGSHAVGNHSRTDSGEDFCLGADAADALKTSIRTDCLCSELEAWCEERGRRALEDDFDDNVSDESGYVEAAPEAMVRRHGGHVKDHVKEHMLRGQQFVQV